MTYMKKRVSLFIKVPTSFFFFNDMIYLLFNNLLNHKLTKIDHVTHDFEIAYMLNNITATLIKTIL